MKWLKNRKNMLAVLGTGALLWMLAACSDNPLVLQYNLNNPQILGEVQDTVLYATLDTTYLLKSRLSNGLSPRLAIGSFAGFEARPILRFTRGLPDSAIFTAARIQFKADGYYSDGAPQPFVATAYPALNIWISNVDSVWNDYTQNFDPAEPLGSVDILPSQSDSFKMELNDAGLQKLAVWADTSRTDENYGMILHFESANFLQYLTSINVDTDPTLVVEPMLIFEYHTATDPATKTDTVSATYDAYVYSANVPTRPDRDYVATQAYYVTLLKFDLDGLFTKYNGNIDVLSANLQLPVDKENSLLSQENAGNLQVQKLLSDITTASVRVDSAFDRLVSLNQWSADSTYLEVNSGNARQTFARFVLQSQLGNLKESSALMVDFQNPAESYSYLAFYKRKVAEKGLLPRLFLTFRVPPPSRL